MPGSANLGWRYPAIHRRLAAQTGSGSPESRNSQPAAWQAAAARRTCSGSHRQTGLLGGSR